MLWHFHGIQAGFFPNNWLNVLLVDGFSDGLSIGWFIIMMSFLYNLAGFFCMLFSDKKT